MQLLNVAESLLRSRKFWLMLGACVVASLNGRADLIPGIIMLEIGAITAEDFAHKLGLNWTTPEEPLLPPGDAATRLRVQESADRKEAA